MMKKNEDTAVVLVLIFFFAGIVAIMLLVGAYMGNVPKVGQVLTEVPKYVETAETEYIKRDEKGVETFLTKEQYDSVVLIPGKEIAYSRHPKVLNTLENGEYYYDGPDQSSTSPMVVVKRIGEPETRTAKSDL